MAKILMMLSGGVDSSVAAYLLKKQGHTVIGLTLSLWYDGDSNTCCGVTANCRAKELCDKLGIEHFSLNKRRDFMKHVVNPYIDSYNSLKTPSPCLDCNTHIKIGGMVQHADFFECEYVATGHYIRTDGTKLFSARDIAKDQSYMLSRIDKALIPRLMFPLGDMLKSDIRNIAEANGIYAPRDSQDLCFVEKSNRAEFLESHGVIFNHGEIVNTSGNVLAKHNGIYNYTIGQRKGLPSTSDGRLYVLRVNKDKNQVIVGSENELFVKTCNVNDFNWHYTPITNRIRVKIRYKAAPVWASFKKDNGIVSLVFDEEQKAVVNGQAAVFYGDDDSVIGGGIFNN